MSFLAGSAGKTVSMATNACFISWPSHFADFKTCVSIPYNPMKIRFYCKPIPSKLPSSTFSIKKEQRLFSLAVIASQQEDNNPVFLVDEEEPEGEESDAGSDDGYADPPEGVKLYVGNLPYDVETDSLAQLFQKAGVVEMAEIIYNRETDRSRGFGFVTMETEEEADRAVEIFNGYDLGGRLLTVSKAAPKGSRSELPPRVYNPGYRIYVGNLPWSADDARLEEIFSEHGKVISARVVSDRETGRSRGFGFVVMSSEAEMNDAIASLDGQTLDGRSIRVNVAEERPRRSF